MLINSVKQLCKLRKGLDRLGIHILWRKYVLKANTEKVGIYKYLFFGYKIAKLTMCETDLVPVHSSSEEMCTVCNLSECLLFSISSCKRTDLNLQGFKSNYYMTCYVHSAVDDIKRT
jgi:hypothetical protein